MNIILKLSLVLFVVGSIQGNPTPRKKGYGPGEQEWGHIDVRRGAHMFYWLFYVQDPKVTSYYDRPLVIWLGGGPGSSSSGFGNFEEIGPLFVNGTARPTSWAKHVNLMFIDNPVGAGFSYVDSLKDLPRDNIQIGKDMVAFLTAFYKQFPKFEKSSLYIYGEFYGGKTAVEISKQLLEAIKNKKIKMNFKGVGLGDPLISFMDSVNTWAPFLFFTGLIDINGLVRLKAGAQEIQKAVDSGKWKEASELSGKYWVFVMRETGNVDFSNILYKVPPWFDFHDRRSVGDLITPRYNPEELHKLMNGPVKKALGISPNIYYDHDWLHCLSALEEDIMKPVIHVVEELLNNTSLQVVVYNGNLDLFVDTPGTHVWVNSMHWKHSNAWKTAPQKPLVLNKFIEGYVKNVGNLYLYTVHRAGYMVPVDNPHTALEILRRSTDYDKRNVDASEKSEQ